MVENTFCPITHVSRAASIPSLYPGASAERLRLRSGNGHGFRNGDRFIGRRRGTRQNHDYERGYWARPFYGIQWNRQLRGSRSRHRPLPAPGGGGELQDLQTNWYHPDRRDRKSTRLNSSHVEISYAVFCLKK